MCTKAQLAAMGGQLKAIEGRLVRVESRVVQIMNHLGIKPKGAIPDEFRKPTKQKGQA